MSIPAPARQPRPPMTRREPRDEIRHPLAPHGWPMEPLVLIEDAPDGPYLTPLLPSVAPSRATVPDHRDDAELHHLADTLIAELTAH